MNHGRVLRGASRVVRNGSPNALLFRLCLVVLIAACAACAACSHTNAPKNPGATDKRANGAPSGQVLVGHMIGTVSEHAIGPYIARAKGRSGLVAWVTPPEANLRRIVALPVTDAGEPRGAAKTIANVGIDTTMLVVKESRGKTNGFVVAWTSLTDKGEALWAVVADESGTPRTKAVELARTSDDIVWVDVVPTDIGAVVVWAEETRGSDANVLAASLDHEGAVHGVPARIARQVTGWHALEVPGGVGISTVTSADKRAHGGSLAFQKLDAEGHPAAPPVTVVTKPSVSGDVEVVRAAGKFVFAWTDRTTNEPAVSVASLGDDSKSQVSERLIEARGGATLLGLAAGPAATAVMWEANTRPGGDVRKLYLARMGAGNRLEGKGVSVDFLGRAAPELAATSTGFAMLALVRDCEPGTPKCVEAAAIPSLVRTDTSLSIVQREAFGFGTDPASMAWGLSCHGDACLSLAASGASPTRVRAAEVHARVNVKPAPGDVAGANNGPHIQDVSAIVVGENVVDMATTHFGESTMLATLSTKAEAAGGKGHSGGEDARRAPLSLATRMIDEAGIVSAPQVLTTRALAVGGVAVAPAEKPEDGGVVAWVALDNGDPEVHVTKVDRKGRRVAEVQLTTVKGDASDVAIVWAGSGWVVAWIDGRDGNGEVYATRLSTELGRGNGERLTQAPGDASDLVALAVGEKVWLAWADPRENPRDGMADVFLTAVNTKDAKRVVDEQRLLATAAHSRSPQLAAGAGGDVFLAWVEEAPPGVESPNASGYGAMWTTVSATGKSTKPVKLPLGGEGAAASVALEARDGRLRAIIARSTSEAVALDALDLSAPSLIAFPLITLDGPPSLDVALVLDRGVLYFNDDGPAAADKRARRARIRWNP